MTSKSILVQKRMGGLNKLPATWPQLFPHSTTQMTRWRVRGRATLNGPPPHNGEGNPPAFPPSQVVDDLAQQSQDLRTQLNLGKSHPPPPPPLLASEKPISAPFLQGEEEGDFPNLDMTSFQELQHWTQTSDRITIYIVA